MQNPQNVNSKKTKQKKKKKFQSVSDQKNAGKNQMLVL